MEAQSMPEQQQASEAGTNNTRHKRPIKPEEQALLDELKILAEQHGQQFPTICSFVKKEADRITKGYKSAEEEKTLDIESGKPIRMTYKVTIPTEKYPNFNFVGRLLGPGGTTLRELAETSHCKLAVLGKGSMRDKEQEEKCRAEGGKYTHLNDPLHVWMQAFGTPDVVFHNLYLACLHLKEYLHAVYNDDIFNGQMAGLEQTGRLPKGYTAARANAHRGMGRGLSRNMFHSLTSVSRGMMSGVGGMTRGHHLAARGTMRGMVRGRGNHSRGRGGRGGANRPPNNSLQSSATTGVGSASAPETLYEDVYEPAPPLSSAPASFLNGSNGAAASGGASAYFDEFPEPGMSASGDASLPGGYKRQNSSNMKLQQKNHMTSPHNVTTVSGAASTPVQQRAY